MNQSESFCNLIAADFPDKIVYEPEFFQKGYSYSVFKEAKRTGSSVKDYVQKLGFTWKSVERCMDFTPHKISMNQSLTQIVAEIFETQALLGNVILPDPIKEELYQSAREVFREAVIQGSSVSIAKKKLLLLETIYIVQEKFGPHKEDEPNEENKSIWKYIFCEYSGHTVESDDPIYTKSYTFFCKLIRNVLDKTGHMRIPDKINGKKKQQYYDTLLIHAQAPIEDLNSFFRILFDFYVNTMDCQYGPNDPIFKHLVKALRARENENIEVNVSIRSDSITAASYALLAQCQYYGYQYCEDLIRKIDYITKDGDISSRDSELDIEQNYLDRALYTWYLHQSAQTRTEARQKRRISHGERLATEQKLIHASYELSGESVKIVLPKIRFEEKFCKMIEKDGKPTVTVYCNNQKIAVDSLSYFGQREMHVYTSRAYSYDLARNAPENLQYRICVTVEGVADSYEDSLVYDSDRDESIHTLQRDALIFNELHYEITAIHPGITDRVTVFVPLRSEISVDGDSECVEMEPCNFAQRLLVYSSGLHALTVGQKDIYADSVARNRFRVKPSHNREDVCWMHDGVSYDVYSDLADFVITIPDDKHIEEYQIEINQQVSPLAKYYKEREVFLPAECQPGRHKIRIVEVNNGRTICEINYVFLPGFHVQLDRSLYFDEEKEITVTLRADAAEPKTLIVASHQGDESIEIAYLYEDKLRIPLPVFRARFMDKPLSEFEGQFLWWKTITMDHMLTFSGPKEWTPHLWLGNSEILQSRKGNVFEVGNYLVPYEKEGKNQESLILRLESEGHLPILKQLAEILFTPKLTGKPISLEEDSLQWEIEGLYIGPDTDTFYLELQVHANEAPWEYRLGASNEVIEKKIKLEDGKYPYTIYIMENHFFKKTKRVIYSGEIIFGDPNSLRFKNADILLRSASAINIKTGKYENTTLKQGTYRITHIKYSECELEKGDEKQGCPRYTGILEYWSQKKYCWLPFFSEEDEQRYPESNRDTINPITFWIISNHFLMMLEASGDPMYMDTQYGSILEKNSDIERAAKRNQATDPDKFEYELHESEKGYDT